MTWDTNPLNLLSLEKLMTLILLLNLNQVSTTTLEETEKREKLPRDRRAGITKNLKMTSPQIKATKKTSFLESLKIIHPAEVKTKRGFDTTLIKNLKDLAISKNQKLTILQESKTQIPKEVKALKRMETGTTDTITMMTQISLIEVEEVKGVMISSKWMSADHKVGVEEVKCHKTTLKFMHIDQKAGAGVVIGHKTTFNLNRADQEVEERIWDNKINLVDIETINEESNLILNSKEQKRSKFQKKVNLWFTQMWKAEAIVVDTTNNIQHKTDIGTRKTGKSHLIKKMAKAINLHWSKVAIVATDRTIPTAHANNSTTNSSSPTEGEADWEQEADSEQEAR